MSKTIKKNLEVLVSNAKANSKTVKDQLAAASRHDPDIGVVTAIAMYKDALDKLSQE